MPDDPQSSVEILAENASEFRVYVAQYWSHRHNRRVREYADAVPEADLLLMSQQDRAKVNRYARENLGLEPLTAEVSTSPIHAAPCTPASCAGCRIPCRKNG